ncbi:ABC transporter permease [Ruegeria sp. HKCCD8929]|uniref:ABC transporter permease n=1 Tax=Ruegeria sp. HKCCD8929 TaxID=2683006 RepID=UPI00148810EA|nr:ABC transporter permease [Ruegeria sp. HKCCD8929]
MQTVRINQSGLRTDERLERLKLFGLSSPALLMILVILVLPVGWLFYVSFIGANGEFSLENYERMISRKSYARIFWTTFQVSFLTTGLCILIGYPLAYFLSQLPPRLANLGLITVLLPFWTSLLVRTYAWLVLLQKQGLVNDWAISLGLWDEPIKMVHNMTGTLIGMVHIMLPFLILPVYGAMRSIDLDLMKAASNLGANPRRAFWNVFFPLTMPGLMAGALMVFILCLGFFVTPAVLGGGKVIMVSMQIVSNIELFVNWGAASALGVVLLVLTVAILWIASRFLNLEQMTGGGGH